MKLKKPEFSSIKNIIFDLGGVLLNIDYFLTEKAFAELGISNFAESYSQAKQSTLFDEFEVGRITAREFRDGLRIYMNIDISDEKLDQCWNSMLLDLPETRLDLLHAVKYNYRIFLLSNTNIIHYEAYSQYLNETFGIADFKPVMEKQYLSFEMGMRKPNADCFNAVLNENWLLANETLFIDDSIQHIVGALAVGINAYHLKPTEDVVGLFEFHT